jgi:YidC/Oxa1 family membrane protein insertase
MNDKRSAIAVLVSLMFIMLYQQMFVQPMFEKPVAIGGGQEQLGESSNQSTQANHQSPIVNAGQTSVQVARQGSVGPSLKDLAQSEVTYLETDVLRLAIVHLGGRIRNAQLLGYNRTLNSEEPLDLLRDNDGQTILPGGVHRDLENDGMTMYALERVVGVDGASGSYRAVDPVVKLEFVGTLASGDKVKKIFEVPRADYLLKLTAALEGEPIPGAPLVVDWSHYLPKSELENRLDPREFQYLTEEGRYSNVPVSQLKAGEVKSEPQGRWIAFGGKYFMEALVNSQGHAISFGRDEDRFFSSMQGELHSVEASLYLGPKDRGLLSGVGFDLWKAVDLGWFTVVADPLLWLLRLLYSMLGNYGLAIIGLTLIVKLAMYPLAKTSYTSMSKMQDIQPEVKRIQDLYKDDQQRLQQELMALYKKKGVNPLGGCLPMLFQIPVFLGLYNGLLKSIELRHAPYALWINDLSAPEGLMIFGIPVPVMILLMGASMIIQQWVTPSAADPQQKKIMMMMPVVFTGMFILFPMPSGLVLYWLTNNVISILQQRYMKDHSDASPILATIIASGGIFAVGFIVTLL